ncbi:MAG TPA: hypothetical protein VJO53_12965 [Candidatus Acidoferrales bacterium]|nr:hypothetical protein [Candidatus Acidoferrales bacterium]
MTAPLRKPAPKLVLQQALNRLKQSELDVLTVVRTGTHPKNATLVEAHAFLREAISVLSRATSPAKKM